MPTAEDIEVELVFAESAGSVRRRLTLPAGSTVAIALARSGLEQAVPLEDIGRVATGIFSKRVARDHILVSGDRVELYRPLQADPKDQRRRRAQQAPRTA